MQQSWYFPSLGLTTSNREVVEQTINNLLAQGYSVERFTDRNNVTTVTWERR